MKINGILSNQLSCVACASANMEGNLVEPVETSYVLRCEVQGCPTRHHLLLQNNSTAFTSMTGVSSSRRDAASVRNQPEGMNAIAVITALHSWETQVLGLYYCFLVRNKKQ